MQDVPCQRSYCFHHLMILEYINQAGLPWYTLSTRKSMPVLHTLINYASLITTSTLATKIVLLRTVVGLKWARMKLKLQKSSSLVIKGRKCTDKQLFEVVGEIFPSIQWEPLRILGRVYNGSVTDRLAQGNLNT